jgi:hypothetical protein
VLLSLTLPFSIQEMKNRYSATDIENACRTFKQRHLHLQVPPHFVISDEETEGSFLYPKNMLGAPLGHIVQLIRSRRLYFTSPDWRLHWRPLGLTLDPWRQGRQCAVFCDTELSSLSFQRMSMESPTKKGKLDARFAILWLALNEFKTRYGHCRVPKPYVIPAGLGFTKDLEGMKLGNSYDSIYTRAQWTSHPYRSKLEALEVIPKQTTVGFSGF